MNKLELLEKHFSDNKDTLVKIAKRKVGEFWADDVVQEAYTRCIKYSDKLPDDDKLINAYVYTTLRNIMIDYLRDRISVDEVEEDMLESGELVDEWGAKGVLASIKADMLKLPSPKKEIIYCALIQGERYETLSKIFNVTIPAAHMMVYTYRKELLEKYNV